MKAYMSIIKIRFILLLQYRVAALAGACTQFFFGIVRVMVFYAFYQSNLGENPLTYSQAITYIWMGQAMMGMLPWNGDSEIQNSIRSGNVAYELLRPISLYNQWYSRAIALRTAPTLLRSIPIFIITLFLLPKDYSMSFPPSSVALLAWIVSTIGALLLSCAITNIINISTLWTISGDGIQRLISAVVTIFSGMIVPLPLFPDWLKGILRILPFSGLVDTPLGFYTGHISASQIFTYLGHQIIWTVILYAFGQWILNKKMKAIVVLGG